MNKLYGNTNTILQKIPIDDFKWVNQARENLMKIS